MARVKCIICNEMVQYKVLRRHYFWNHLQLKPFQCKHCSFKSTSPFRIFNPHYKQAHGDGNVGNVCDVKPVMDTISIIEKFEQKNGLDFGNPLYKIPSRKRKDQYSTKNYRFFGAFGENLKHFLDFYRRTDF